MLEQKKGQLLDFADNPEVLRRSEMIEIEESKIDIDEKVHLITWAPDPKRMPKVDFNLQHNTNVTILADYLKCCRCGLFCVENTQLGNPHYHGWYQTCDDELEFGRVAMVKTMEHFGIVKITEARTVKINSYTKVSNALYYYKYDLYMSLSASSPNPISAQTETLVNYDTLKFASFFMPSLDAHSKAANKAAEQRVSDIKFYQRFYTDTVSLLDGTKYL